MVPVAKQVRLSTKGQLVLPLEVRKRMRLRPGDRLVIVGEDDMATLMKPQRYAESLRGAARGTYGRTRAAIDAYVRGERRMWPR
jgi:AbrB family looped-hinge helix DNA binding protein